MDDFRYTKNEIMLEHLFGSLTRIKLLRLFYGNPERAYFVRELSRTIEIQLNAVRRELANLEERNFIDLLKKRAGSIKVMILTGFFTNTPDVGTDILFVGEIKSIAVAKVMKDFEKFLNHPVRYTILDEKEFSERREIGDRFLYSIFEAKHIFAVDELKIS